MISNRQLRRGLPHPAPARIAPRAAEIASLAATTLPHRAVELLLFTGSELQLRHKIRAQRLHFACPEERRAAKFPRGLDVALALDSVCELSIFSRSGHRSSNRNTTAFKNRANSLQTKHKTFSNRNKKPGVAVRVLLRVAPARWTIQWSSMLYSAYTGEMND